MRRRILLGGADKYANQYLTFVALESGTFKNNTNAINYSLDDGVTWTTLAANTDSPTVAAGSSIMWKATLTPKSASGVGTFSSTGQFDVEGNPMSLLYGDSFKGKKELKNYAFLYLFDGASGLVNATNLALIAPTLTKQCYRFMFQNCTSLVTTPKLPATTLNNLCYNRMFGGCTSLTTAPVLPATTLAESCYYQMFRECTSLVIAPELPATTLAEQCYSYMFYACTALIVAPELPATTLVNACYDRMFYNCTSLTTAPELPATTLVEQCYYQMFRGCTSLNYIKCLLTDGTNNNTTKPLTNWVLDVADSGTFVKAKGDTGWAIDSAHGIPTGWTVVENYDDATFDPTESFTPAGYLTFTASNDVSYIAVKKKATAQTFYISKNGTTWQQMSVNESYAMSTGESYYVCGMLTAAPPEPAPDADKTNRNNFDIGGRVSVSGNINSLWDYSNLSTPLKDCCGFDLFRECKGLVDASGLTFPATIVPRFGYAQMFLYCTNLLSAPSILPATSVDYRSYRGMFSSCLRLKAAPEISATTFGKQSCVNMFYNCTSLTTAPRKLGNINTVMTERCFYYMFHDCISLRNAPELPATTLGSESYAYMFQNCTSLTVAPEIPATTVDYQSCYAMFNGCSSLLTITNNLPATTLAEGCYYGMFNNCSKITVAPIIAATTLATDCCAGMFQFCSKLQTVQETLPATTLAEGCYYGMFIGCALTTAPTLPATTLITDCYKEMFKNCSNLNYIEAMFTTTPSDTYTRNWVGGVASHGTFVKNPVATWNVRGTNGIPSGWSIINDVKYVDLGLTSGTLWAQSNIVKDSSGNYSIGDNPEDYGCYFSWGNIEGHNCTDGSVFDDGYEFTSANYNSTSGASLTGDISSSDTAHDAARALLGGTWRLPTKEEFKELNDETDHEWVTLSGVNGYKFMKKTDHSVFIFLPAAGRGNNTTFQNRGTNGYYWSSSYYSASQSYNILFSSTTVSPQNTNTRKLGVSIRPVK